MNKRLVPDNECAQRKCACTTTGCWGECSLKLLPVVYTAPAQQSIEIDSLEFSTDGKLASAVLIVRGERVRMDVQQEAKPDLVAQYQAALRSVNAVAIERGDKYGACDQIDNDGQPYQSQWFADLLAMAPQAEAPSQSDKQEDGGRGGEVSQRLQWNRSRNRRLAPARLATGRIQRDRALPLLRPRPPLPDRPELGRHDEV